jgi:predicted O-methyltransferase YrrM
MRLSGISRDKLLEKILDGVSLYTLRKATRSTLSDAARAKGEAAFDQTIALYREIASLRGLDINEILSGSIKRKEGSFLHGLLTQHKPATVLEVGTFVGFSTLIIAEALRANGSGKLYSIDPWITHRAIRNPVEIAMWAAKQRGLSNMIEFSRGWLYPGPHQPSSSHDGNIPIVAKGAVLLPQIAPLDFVFIDGDHSILNTLGDISAALGFLKAGGLCVIHDIYSWPSVRRAITDLLSDSPIRGMFRFEVLEGSDGLGIFCKVRETVAVSVRVQARQTKKAIAGATLSARGQGSTSTDADGKIYVPGVPAGDYHITVRSAGYEPIDDCCVHVNNGGRFQEVIIEMDKK